MQEKKLFFQECHLAGRQYHEADEVWDELKVGTRLELVRDMENRYDPKAVEVIYHGKDAETGEPEDFRLGYLPAAENGVISAFLEMGWKDVFECRISKITPEAHYENQIRLTIRILEKESPNNIPEIRP